MSGQAGDGDCPIKVVVRSRPLNKEEKACNTPSLVHCESERGKVTVTTKVGNTRGSKAYNFDMVFGPYATQSEVYNGVVRPIVDEVLLGYNCTVFAYGQTGTGKTHTMEGIPEDAEMMGVIPRAVNTIFECLEACEGTEYTVKVSFLELYNEELQDLLSATDDVKLRILDDKSRIGTGVSCHNLEEVMVKYGDDILSVMQRAMAKRQVAATNLNKTSSRSHCIFTLTVHIKETTPEGEDLLKVGKLNLVDLAGSECIGRSGATNQRAREAGNINKSLLTLGRVISALVEKTPHIPYRDSKLTRLLQESLGGRAKTCIIATVAPSVQCLDETLSTLDYASRAKNIKNRPEANQKMTKRAVLKEYAEDIERLRQELASARAKDGVYLQEATYNEMVQSLESQKNQIEELEAVLEDRLKEFQELKDLFDTTSETLEQTQGKLIDVEGALETTKVQLEETEEELKDTKVVVEETRHIVKAHQSTEAALHSDAAEWHSTIETTTDHIQKLHEKIDRKVSVETHNARAAESHHNDTLLALRQMSELTETFCADHTQRHNLLLQSLSEFTNTYSAQTKTILETVGKLSSRSLEGIDNVSQTQQEFCNTKAIDSWHGMESKIKGELETQRQAITTASTIMHKPLKAVVEDILINQAGQLARHSKIVEGHLDESQRNIQAYREAQSASIDRISEKVHADHVSHRDALSRHSRNVETMIESEKRRLEAVTAAMTSQLVEMLSKMQTDAVENLNNVMRTVTSENEKISSDIEASEKGHQNDFEQLREDAKVWCDKQCVTLSQFGESLDVNHAAIVKSIAATKETTKEASSHVDEQLTIWNSHIETVEKMIVEDTEGSVAALKDHASTALSMVDDLKCNIKMDTEKVRGVVNVQHEATQSWAEGSKAHATQDVEHVAVHQSNSLRQVSDLSDASNNWIQDIMKIDHPTGSTPRRVGYPYKKQIAKTLPHEELLAQFRENMVLVQEEQPVGKLSFDDTPNEEKPKEIPAEEEDQQDDVDDDVVDVDECKENVSSNIAITMNPVQKGTVPSSDTKDGVQSLSKDDIMKLKVSELRSQLLSRNMSQLGSKAALQTRLMEAME